MFRYACLAAAWLFAGTAADAVVIRHDIEKDRYLTHEAPASMVEMRHQGHGMLIAPQWVVTAAHVVFYDYRDKTITIGGQEREIAHVIFHPGYAKPQKGVFSGYSGPSQAYLRGNHDVALIKLKQPVDDVAPVQIYSASDETGQHIRFYGRGNTGDGLTGQIQNTRGTLRMGENILLDAADQWLYYRFDQGAAALSLEAIQGDGDSGGPALIRKDGIDYLAGLASWDVYDGDIAEFRGGLYGMSAAVIRLSYYAGWIAEVQSWSEEDLASAHHKVGGQGQ